jgi:VWFA-related protein
MSSLRSLLFLVFLGAAAVAATLHAAQVQRTIYVTASATDGSALTGLAAADLVVKEGGLPRPVVRVEPSRATLQVAVAVEELLTPDNDVRRAVANFIDRIRESGELALYVVGRRSEKRVDYTSDILRFASAINRFPVRSVERGDVVQALHEIARDQRTREGRRALVAVAVETAQPSSMTADGVIEQLGAARSVLYAATLAGGETSTVPSGATSGGRRLDLEGQVAGLERDRVFNDATRQSGGLHLSSQRTAGLFAALERIAAELNRQFVVSYDGDAKSDGGVSVEAARPGVSVRGPARVR